MVIDKRWMLVRVNSKLIAIPKYCDLGYRIWLSSNGTTCWIQELLERFDAMKNLLTQGISNHSLISAFATYIGVNWHNVVDGASRPFLVSHSHIFLVTKTYRCTVSFVLTIFLYCNSRDSNFVLVGDSNMPNILWSNEAENIPLPTRQISKTFLSFTLDHGLKQHVLFPTHFKGNTLDLFSNFDLYPIFTGWRFRSIWPHSHYLWLFSFFSIGFHCYCSLHQTNL